MCGSDLEFGRGVHDLNSPSITLHRGLIAFDARQVPEKEVRAKALGVRQSSAKA